MEANKNQKRFVNVKIKIHNVRPSTVRYLKRPVNRNLWAVAQPLAP